MIRLLSASITLALSLAFIATAQQHRYDRDIDGLLGPVRAVQDDVSKLSYKSGKPVEGKREFKRSASYDPKGRIIGEVFADENMELNQYAYTYDSKGVRRLKHKADWLSAWLRGGNYNPMDTEFIRSEYKYDSFGKRIEETTYRADTVLARTTYSYYGGERVQEKVVYDRKGKVILKEVYAYDPKGSVAELSQLQRGNNSVRMERYSYEYDPPGNWVKRITLRAKPEGSQVNFTPIEVTYRTISYY